MLDTITTISRPPLPSFMASEVDTVRSWRLLNTRVEHTLDEMEEPDAADVLRWFTVQPRNTLIAEARRTETGVSVFLYDQDRCGIDGTFEVACDSIEDVRAAIVEQLTAP